MNAYEAKQAARRTRLESLAATANAEAAATHARAKQMADAIPFGQPILVGHHSEGKDRRYRAKIHNTFGKSFEAHEKAQHYARKAASVGTGGISSDDPDAIPKLREELAGLEASQDAMKQTNAMLRKAKNPEDKLAALLDAGFSEARAKLILTPDCFGNIGFADFTMRNQGANIRRIKARIEELEKRSQQPTVEHTGKGYTCRQDADENRVMFVFDGKPDETTRDLLKRHAFKWSPTRGAWVRQTTNAAVYAAQQICTALDK